MNPIERFYVHTVQVATNWPTGNAYGDSLATPVPVVGFFSGSTKLVRGKDGNIVQAASMFYTYTKYAPLFTTDSVVTAPDGSSGRVVTFDVNDSGPLGLPDHLAVALI